MIGRECVLLVCGGDKRKQASDIERGRWNTSKITRKGAEPHETQSQHFTRRVRHLAQAQGIAKVAKAAGIERESLYRALSVRGNPRLSTLVAVTKAIGLRLTVEAAQVPRIRGQVPEVQGPLPNPLGLRPGTKRGQLRTNFGWSDESTAAAALRRSPAQRARTCCGYRMWCGRGLSAATGPATRGHSGRRCLQSP